MCAVTRIDHARRRFCLALASLAATAAATRSACVAALGRGPVRILLAQTPGTTPDVIARILAPKFAERWGQPFVVENRAGASGAIGMEAVTKAAPDGHTINVNVSTTLTLPFFYRNVPFDVLSAFEPLGMIGSGNFALVSHSSMPVANLREYLEYVKARPGQIHYASPGNGTHHHLCMELLRVATGIDVVHVPYKGTAGATTDLIAGQIPTMFLPIHVALGYAKEGRIRILGGSKRERHSLFPAIPSLHEQGVRDFDVDPWYALWGPAGMAPELVAKYNGELNAILALAEVGKALAAQGLLVKPGTPEDLAEKARAEHAMWARVVREARIEAT